MTVSSYALNSIYKYSQFFWYPSPSYMRWIVFSKLFRPLHIFSQETVTLKGFKICYSKITEIVQGFDKLNLMWHLVAEAKGLIFVFGSWWHLFVTRPITLPYVTPADVPPFTIAFVCGNWGFWESWCNY